MSLRQLNFLNCKKVLLFFLLNALLITSNLVYSATSQKSDNDWNTFQTFDPTKTSALDHDVKGTSPDDIEDDYKESDVEQPLLDHKFSDWGKK